MQFLFSCSIPFSMLKYFHDITNSFSSYNIRKEAKKLNIKNSCISYIDTDWSYQLAKCMEKEKTNSVLGYRTVQFTAVGIDLTGVKKLRQIAGKKLREKPFSGIVIRDQCMI